MNAIATNCRTSIPHSWGMRQQIRTKSELRTRLHSIAGRQYPNFARTASEDEKAAFLSIPDYSDRQLKEELVPTYEKMANLFTDRMCLAEPSTRMHYQKLIEVVEIWKRFLANTIPSSVDKEIGHTEADLEPFYKDLESIFNRLQKKLG
jgi:hypothetical protein